MTISEPVMVALEILAQRHGVKVSTQAMACLRASVERTITSKDCQDRLRARRAFMGAIDRMTDIGDERFIERTYELVGGENV